jgi:ribose 5-phosphate isomerase RpiB
MSAGGQWRVDGGGIALRNSMANRHVGVRGCAAALERGVPHHPRTQIIRIALGADHAGFELKQELAASLRRLGKEVVDLGAHQLDPTDDYVDYAVAVAKAVAGGGADRGILICGSGVGVTVVGSALAGELVSAFLNATFTGEARHVRRLGKITQLEAAWAGPGLRETKR